VPPTTALATVPDSARPAVQIDAPARADQPPLDRSARRRGPTVALGAGGGIAISGASADRTGFGQLDVAWFPRRSPWLIRGVAGIDAPIAITPSNTDRLEVWRAQVRIEAGRRFAAGAGWIQPATGIGVAVLRVDPVDLAGASPRWRAQPVATAGVAAGIPLARRLALRIEATASLFLVTHRYVVEPDGPIGRSPRAAFAVGGAVEWTFE
jgi:hypothetical protein